MNFTELTTAIRDNKIDAVIESLWASPDARKLLNAKNDVPYADWFSGLGATPLQMISFLKPEYGPALIEMGATVDLHSACALGQTEAIDRILTEDPQAIDVEVDSFFPIQFALRNADSLRQLLSHGDDPNRGLKRIGWFDWEAKAIERGISQWYPMHMVALGRGGVPTLEVAEILVTAGADASASSLPFGEAPLHIAAIYDQAKTIQWLVENGVDVNLRTVKGSDPVATKDLFEQEPFQPFNAQGQTALMLAAGEGQESAVKTLIAQGASTSAQDDAGFTPLHYAAGAFWQENVDVLDRVIDAGGDPELLSESGQTPQDLAIKKNYQATAKRLASIG